jgi:predicted component of type VI protein secretion system
MPALAITMPKIKANKTSIEKVRRQIRKVLSSFIPRLFRIDLLVTTLISSERFPFLDFHIDGVEILGSLLRVRMALVTCPFH